MKKYSFYKNECLYTNDKFVTNELISERNSSIYDKNIFTPEEVYDKVKRKRRVFSFFLIFLIFLLIISFLIYIILNSSLFFRKILKKPVSDDGFYEVLSSFNGIQYILYTYSGNYKGNFGLLLNSQSQNQNKTFNFDFIFTINPQQQYDNMNKLIVESYLEILKKTLNQKNNNQFIINIHKDDDDYIVMTISFNIDENNLMINNGIEVSDYMTIIDKKLLYLSDIINDSFDIMKNYKQEVVEEYRKIISNIKSKDFSFDNYINIEDVDADSQMIDEIIMNIKMSKNMNLQVYTSISSDVTQKKICSFLNRINIYNSKSIFAYKENRPKRKEAFKNKLTGNLNLVFNKSISMSMPKSNLIKIIYTIPFKSRYDQLLYKKIKPLLKYLLNHHGENSLYSLILNTYKRLIYTYECVFIEKNRQSQIEFNMIVSNEAIFGISTYDYIISMIRTVFEYVNFMKQDNFTIFNQEFLKKIQIFFKNDFDFNRKKGFDYKQSISNSFFLSLSYNNIFTYENILYGYNIDEEYDIDYLKTVFNRISFSDISIVILLDSIHENKNENEKFFQKQILNDFNKDEDLNSILSNARLVLIEYFQKFPIFNSNTTLTTNLTLAYNLTISDYEIKGNIKKIIDNCKNEVFDEDLVSNFDVLKMYIDSSKESIKDLLINNNKNEKYTYTYNSTNNSNSSDINQSTNLNQTSSTTQLLTKNEDENDKKMKEKLTITNNFNLNNNKSSVSEVKIGLKLKINTKSDTDDIYIILLSHLISKKIKNNNYFHNINLLLNKDFHIKINTTESKIEFFYEVFNDKALNTIKTILSTMKNSIINLTSQEYYTEYHRYIEYLYIKDSHEIQFIVNSYKKKDIQYEDFYDYFQLLIKNSMILFDVYVDGIFSMDNKDRLDLFRLVDF